MNGTQPGELGVLAWCNMVRFTMAQDPGRTFLDHQIQLQGFDFLDNYLDNVISRSKDESVYELLKTPGRKKTAAKRTRTATTPVPKDNTAVIISLEETISEKENIIPVNNFHKALLDAKDTPEDVMEQDLTLGDSPAKEIMEAPATVTVREVSPQDQPEPHSSTSQSLALSQEDTVQEDMTTIGLALQPDPPDAGLARSDSIKELSIIAEDDEHSRILPQLPDPTSGSDVDMTVPVRDADTVVTAPALVRKPSTSQFSGLPAPSPLRKSTKLPREPSSSSLIIPALAHTPGAGLGGKRTSWLTKAKEIKALEMTGGSGGVGLGITLANKKRKSGDMLGQANPQTDNIADGEAERKLKLAKFVETAQDSSTSQAQVTGSDTQPEYALPLQPSHPPVSIDRITPVQTYSSFSSADDFTVPLADVSEEGALDKLKRTVEGFGVRGKSMSKSLGGNAAVALAEARAAAQARVAERNKEEGAEVIVEPLPTPLTVAALPEPVIGQTSERRLSVSDLVSSSEQKPNSPLGAIGPSESNVADISTSTTPPDSPPSSKLQQDSAPPPVFSKPPAVFIAPSTAPVDHVPAKFKLPATHPFSLPPAVALGVHSSLSPSNQFKSQGLSAQSSKASIFSDAIFDKEDDIPAWLPSTQDTQYSIQPSIESTRDKYDDVLDEDDSWHVDEKFKSNQMWTPFGFASADKDDTMTWSTMPSRSTSQKGGDTDRIQNITEAFEQVASQERNPFDFQAEDAMDIAQAEIDVADMSMDIDDDEYPGESDLEDIVLAGKSTISLVQPQESGPRSQSQQSMASTSSSQSQQLGFFGQATKLMTSVLGGGKKVKAEPVKSIQRAAAVAKKQQEEAEKKASRLKDMETRRQQALQRKADEEKLRAQEEEKKYKEDVEKRKREREEATEKRPLRSTTKKVVEDDTTKKRKLVVEADKKTETKKLPPRDQPSRAGKAPASAAKTGGPLKSALKPPSTSMVAPVLPNTASTLLKEPVTKAVKPAPLSNTLKSTASLKGKGKAQNADDIDQPSHVVQTQMANRAKAQMQAAQPSRVASETIELPEINSEYSDSDDEDRPKKFDPPGWAQSPELRQALQQQSTMNPDDIFGQIRPLRMEEIFRTRTSRFRARTSSANWSGADQLTAEEEKAYERRMGYK